MAVGMLIAFAFGASFGYIMCAVLSANMTDEEWQRICGAPTQPVGQYPGMESTMWNKLLRLWEKEKTKRDLYEGDEQ